VEGSLWRRPCIDRKGAAGAQGRRHISDHLRNSAYLLYEYGEGKKFSVQGNKFEKDFILFIFFSSKKITINFFHEDCIQPILVI